MWKGPSAALRATYADPVASRLHRRAGEQGIAYNTLDHEGLSVEVFRMIRRDDGTYFCPVLGQAHGGDPMNTFINAALQYTEHDAELFALIARDIERRENEIHTIWRGLSKKLEVMADTISDSLVSLRCRHVRA